MCSFSVREGREIDVVAVLYSSTHWNVVFLFNLHQHWTVYEGCALFYRHGGKSECDANFRGRSLDGFTERTFFPDRIFASIFRDLGSHYGTIPGLSLHSHCFKCIKDTHWTLSQRGTVTSTLFFFFLADSVSVMKNQNKQYYQPISLMNEADSTLNLLGKILFKKEKRTKYSQVTSKSLWFGRTCAFGPRWVFLFIFYPSLD